MKLSTLTAAAVALAMPVLAAGAAQAVPAAPVSGGTLEVGYTRAAFDTDVGSFGYNTVHLRAGGQFSKNWGVEMEGGFGVGSDTISGVEVKQSWELGVYVDGYIPTGPNGDVILRGGFTRTRSKVSAGGGSADADDHGAALGVGYRYFPGGGANGLRVDYTHYFYSGGDKVNAFSVGYVRKF